MTRCEHLCCAMHPHDKTRWLVRAGVSVQHRLTVRGFARQHKGREAAALSAGSLHDSKVVLAPNRKKLPV